MLPLGAVPTRTPSLVRAEPTFSAFTPEREYRVGIRKHFWYAEKTRDGGRIAHGGRNHQDPLLGQDRAHLLSLHP